MSVEPFQQLSDGLAVAETAEDFHAVLRRLLETFDRLNAETIARSGAKLDCRAGCALCCSLRVDVFAHEVFLLADHVRRNFSEEEFARLRARLIAHEERVLPLTPFEDATQNRPCPLLREDGHCSVYEARPHSCRRHHSLDLSACQFTYEHPADVEFPAAHDGELYRTLSGAMEAAGRVYAAHGFDTTIYELGTALLEALDSPESWEAWRTNQEAFVRASVTPSA